jgi:hypothetical protein
MPTADRRHPVLGRRHSVSFLRKEKKPDRPRTVGFLRPVGEVMQPDHALQLIQNPLVRRRERLFFILSPGSCVLRLTRACESLSIRGSLLVIPIELDRALYLCDSPFFYLRTQ